MENIEQNVATNIQKLRKANGWTQSEFANKLCYSDKAVSKWERGDSTPDINMLNEIAKLFNVNVDYLIKEHNEIEIKNTKNNTQLFIRNLLVTIMLCVAVFLIATVIFSGLTMKDSALAKQSWISFVAATPLCSLIVYFYGRKEKKWLIKLISLSILVWTLITTAYCATLISGLYNFWLLYIIGAPIQAAICLIYFWKRTF